MPRADIVIEIQTSPRFVLSLHLLRIGRLFDIRFGLQRFESVRHNLAQAWKCNEQPS
jgi:hypothetical protein